MGVGELDAVERGGGGVGEDGVAVGEFGGEHTGGGDHLEGGAGGLQPVEADAGDGQDLAARGLHCDDPAELAAECGDGGLLDGGGDACV